ncbi:MAG: hypothetical protein PWQ55_504 [Chloroflexota bacterium]|nr:hypothetical protein [Chloroflexota bacterium]
MKMDFIVAVVTISLALAFYSLGVWSEKFAGRLRGRHLALFWIGLVFDTTGTSLMGEIAGGLEFDLHGITGMFAILLMLSHALWATIVFLRKDERQLREFHRFSLFVWLVWLVPYFTGMLAAMLR